MRTYEQTPTFVYGPINAEDLARVPRTRWLVTSGMNSAGHPDGHLFLVDTVEETTTELFPAATTHRLDRERFGEADPPAASGFSACGIAIRDGGATGVHELYVVNHGVDAIEVFEIDASDADAAPSCTWIGTIKAPEGVWGNAVAPLPDGGIVATNYLDQRDPDAFDKVFKGEVTGNLQEWHPGTGWTDVPGSELSSANGVEVSSDGAWYYANSWSTRSIVKISRGRTPVERYETLVDLLTDNIKWAPDGTLTISGQDATPDAVFATFRVDDICPIPLKVFRIDPDTLAATEVVRFADAEFGTGSTALEVDGDLWVGSARSDRIARFRPQGST